MDSFIKSQLGAARLEQALPNSRAFENKQIEKFNDNVRVNAEKVYQAYVSQGVELAQERKELYLKRSLKNTL